MYIYIYTHTYILAIHFTSRGKSAKHSPLIPQAAAQSGLVDGKVRELAAGTFGDFLLHFLRKLLLEVRAVVQVDQHQGDLVMGIPPDIIH